MPICIAGMHRSGTSMVARLLKECGLILGPEADLYLPSQDNTEGYWENKRFVEINDRLLAHLGGAWDVPPQAPSGWEDDPALDALAAQAEELIRSFEGQSPWGWKDPRTSLTLPFWLKLIPDLKVIVCLRNPVEVGRSLGKRGYSSDALHNSLWAAYNEVPPERVATANLLFTHYNSYFLDAQSELRRLLDFMGMQAGSTEVQLACAAASTSLRHHRATLDSLNSAPGAQAVARLYARLSAQAGPVFWGRLEPEVRLLAASEAEESDALVLLDRLIEKQHDMKAEMAERALNVRRSIAQQEQRNDQLQGRLNAVQNELRTVQSGTLFQAITRYRALIERRLPMGTRRRRYYDRSTQTARILVTEGPRGLWRRWQTRRKALTGYRQTQAKKAGPRPAARASVASKYAEVYSGLLAAASSAEREERVPLAEAATPAKDFPVKLLAFYLPQYHPIPENDEWWGRGFTEWNNVSKAVPQFVGHYQPHLPGELGFYDLRVQEVQRRQVELARHYGIHGFCFYYYWFNGKRLLERPLDAFTADPEIDFPFCLCWANENWTRRWDGQESEILIAQAHSAESDFDFIRDLAPYFEHKNYIKIDGRPVLIVYRAQIMPDPAETARRWKSYCREHNLPEPYLVAAQTFGFSDPRQVGFDAAVEFPPHGIVIPEVPGRVDLLPQNFTGKIYDYQHVVGYMLQKERPEYPLFRTVMTSWDNTARRQESAHIFINNSPQAYKAWLAHDLNYTLQNPRPEERLVFINAWNEWAEGAHLEPDRKYGFAFLQATAEALRSLPAESGRAPAAAPGPFVKRHDTAVILHVYYPELLEEIASYLANLQGDFDLYVSMPEGVKLSEEDIRRRFPEAQIYRCENRGRDVAPFVALFSAIYPLNYKYICKIHTKKTSHRENGGQWRTDILSKLLGSPAVVEEARKCLDARPRVGLVAPRGHVLSSSQFMALNRDNVVRLARKAGFEFEEDAEFGFPAGSMFWFKPAALAPLVMMGIGREDFDDEKGQKDGTLAHAFERFVGLLVQHNGYQIEEIGEKGAASAYHFAAGPRRQDRGVSTDPIIVYQVGKVGSRTMLLSLQRAYQDLGLSVPVHHVHVLEDLDELEQNIRKSFANPVDNLAYIQKSKELRRKIDGNPRQRWKIISLVRDPVARNVGSFFQNLGEYIPDWKERYYSGALTLDELQDYFLKNEAIHVAADWWFDRQLKPLFGIDVFDTEFPVEVGYKIYRSSPRAHLLMLRLEDLNECAAEAIYEFLGLEDFKLHNTNVSESKDYAALYQAFKSRPLPAEYIERMYSSRSARHFYSPEELQAFARRWQAGSEG